MLRNRTRAVTSKQALMADHSSQQPSQPQNYTKPIPSFFGSPRFKAFTTKGLTLTLTETDQAVKSPTSILDHNNNNNKPSSFFPFTNPFAYDLNIINQPKSPKLFSPNDTNPDSKGIGLALLDTLKDKPPTHDHYQDKTSSSTSHSTCNKMVLFGTELRVQIPPPLPPTCLLSPTDFGIKTKTTPTSGNHYVHAVKDSPRVLTGCIPVKEMELSEDYTCIISHGPNPKTTHIFDNCVVESYSTTVTDHKPKSSPAGNGISFLSFCHTCKKNLEQKIDIYIYRGEKAFCSQECRYQEMLLDAEEN